MQTHDEPTSTSNINQIESNTQTYEGIPDEEIENLEQNDEEKIDLINEEILLLDGEK